MARDATEASSWRLATEAAIGEAGYLERRSVGAFICNLVLLVLSRAPAKLALQIDVPSRLTGTGSALVLDGHDGGMVRASVLDGVGQVVHTASHNVTFRVVSGPGTVIGAHNGDVSSHEPNHAPWRSAYHGLVRAVIQVPRQDLALCSSVSYRMAGEQGLQHARGDARPDVGDRRPC